MSELKTRSNSAYAYRVLDGVHEWHYSGQPVIRCNPDKASAQARHFLLNYGVKQWVGDGGAVTAGPDGKVDPFAKYEGMRERAELIESGVDDLLRRGTVERGPAAYVTQALVRLGKAADLEVANGMVKRVADDKFGGEMAKARAFLAQAKVVKQAILDIKAEEALKTSSADADAFLEEFVGA